MTAPREALVLAIIRQGGSRKAFKAALYIVNWAYCREVLQHDPTWKEYMEFWHVSESTNAREVRAFKACFGRQAKVADVWAQLSRSVPAVRTGELEIALGQVLAARWAA